MGAQRHGWFPAGLGAVGLAISQELRVTCHLAFFYDEVLATGTFLLSLACKGLHHDSHENTHERYLVGKLCNHMHAG